MAVGLVLTGNALNDHLIGGFGYDTLVGGSGDDTLSGGVGKDTLKGGVGDGTLDGGAGKSDKLLGGTGADKFAFSTPLSATSTSSCISTGRWIRSYSVTWCVPAWPWCRSTRPTLRWAVPPARRPRSSTMRVTGALFFDKNGASSGLATQIAVLSHAPDLAASNIIVT
jgi:hypothetical protein